MGVAGGHLEQELAELLQRRIEFTHGHAKAGILKPASVHTLRHRFFHDAHTDRRRRVQPSFGGLPTFRTPAVDSRTFSATLSPAQSSFHGLVANTATSGHSTRRGKSSAAKMVAAMSSA